MTLTLEALITFLIHIDSLYCTALLFPIVIYSMLLAQQPATLQHYKNNISRKIGKYIIKGSETPISHDFETNPIIKAAQYILLNKS